MVGVVMSYFPETETAIVVVTAAQIKQLNTTPIEIVPGKSGSVIDLKSVFFVYNFNTTAFGTIDPNDTLVLVNGIPPNCFNNATLPNVTGFLDQTESMGQWDFSIWYAPGASVPPSDLLGKNVSLFQYNLNTGWPNGTNWTTGDGTLTIFVRYTYINVGA